MGDKLYLITYAGGTAAFFDGLRRSLPEKIQTFALEYSGHGKRWREPFYPDYQGLVTDLADQINETLQAGDRVYLFGYSMGSYAAYELTRQQLLKEPVRHLFAGAHAGPDHAGVIYHGFGSMTDEELTKAIVPLGGLDQRLFQNPRFLHIYLEIIRNDYRILETHRYDQNNRMVGCPVTMFYSEQDTPGKARSGWGKITSQVCYVPFEGNHFFLKKHEEEIARILADTIIPMEQGE